MRLMAADGRDKDRPIAAPASPPQAALPCRGNAHIGGVCRMGLHALQAHMHASQEECRPRRGAARLQLCSSGPGGGPLADTLGTRRVQRRPLGSADVTCCLQLSLQPHLSTDEPGQTASGTVSSSWPHGRQRALVRAARPCHWNVATTIS